MRSTVQGSTLAAPVHRTARPPTWCSVYSIRTRPIPTCDPSRSHVSRDTAPACIGYIGAGITGRNEVVARTVTGEAVPDHFDTSLTLLSARLSDKDDTAFILYLSERAK